MKPDTAYLDLLKKREQLYSVKKDFVDSSKGEGKKHLAFLCDKARFAVELDRVEALYPYRSLSVFPMSPVYVLGLFEHRGIIVPVVDICHIVCGCQSVRKYIAVVRCWHGMTLGVTATELADLVNLIPSDILAPGINMHENVRRFIQAELADGTLILSSAIGGIL